jgi:hypothetical protein
MNLSPEYNDRLHAAVKGALILGLGAAAVKVVFRGEKEGWVRVTDAQNFFLVVQEKGRKKINAIAGAVSNYRAGATTEDLEIQFEEGLKITPGQVREIEEVFSTPEPD